MTSGFEEPLTEDEKKILSTFKKGYIAWPVDTGFTESETKVLLNSLKKKLVLRDTMPYRLTAKGKRLFVLYGFKFEC